MAQFMVDITLPRNPNAEFFALVPLQRAHTQKLLEEGIVMGYSLSLDRSKLWVAMNAENEHEAMKILAAFPLVNYFDLNIHPLAFHHTSLMSLIKVSMN
jgi:muconolactone delta-isomerase